MLLIAAALQQELGIALELCRQRERLRVAGVSAWQACRGIDTFHFLKTGVGTLRADRQFRIFLEAYRPSGVLIIGYAGALDPGLRIGDLVAVRRAVLLGGGAQSALPIEELPVEGCWEMAGADQLVQAAAAAGLKAAAVDVLTSAHVVGEPAQKELLFARHRASAVDMETATIARTATSAAIPVSCIRAISDEADDAFLAPFTYAPGRGPMGRASSVLRAGNWMARYRDWRDNSARAQESLRAFLSFYLESFTALPRSV